MADLTSVVDIRDDQQSTGVAPVSPSEITPQQWGQITNEIRLQPTWRYEADKCADYYDNNQLDPDVMEALQERGMGAIINNLIKPTIDVVLGMEAKNRTDWRVSADSDDGQEVAEAMSAKLKEASRNTHIDRAISDAYAGQIKSGIGWAEISRNSDPFKYPYRASFVHRREMYWDWLYREPDRSDARYLIRKRWYDVEQAVLYFPGKADIVRAAGMGWSREYLDRTFEDTSLSNAFDTERGIGMEAHEWRDTNGNRICLMECWYRVHIRGYVLRMPSGKVVELDMKNPVHVASIARGVAKPESAIYTKMRKAIYAGPHKLVDVEVKRNRDPYVMFMGYREDLTGTPYGLIRSMISPQDEINARRQKLMWMLSAYRLQMDSDALDTQYNSAADVLRELARPDATIVTNPNRKNLDGVRVDNNLQVSEQQFQVMLNAEESLQKVGGIYQAMLGDAQGGAKSGLAINSLVEQGSTTLAEINDNYRYARKLAGELLLDLIRDDMIGQQVNVVAGDERQRKIIAVNVPQQDQSTGMQFLANDVERTECKVALEDVPSTPAYRAQMQQMIAQVMSSLPPQIQAAMAPNYIESTELPKRHELADVIRQIVGLAPVGNQQGQDPQVAQLQNTVQALQQQIQQLQGAPDMINAQSKAALDEATIGKIKAETELANIKAAQALQQLDDMITGKDTEKEMT